MATARTVILDAFRSLKVIAPGDEPTIDEIALGLEAVQELILEIHESRGPLTDVDVTADYVASENQRVRVQAGYTVNITLPNAIPLFNLPDPYDYGFAIPIVIPPQGSTGQADGYSWRQPRDGTRIEVTGTGEGLYFYRSDLNAWMALYGPTLQPGFVVSPFAPAYSLIVDQELPLSSRFNAHLGALVAERLAESLPAPADLTPGLQRRAVRARAAIMLQTGRARDPVMADYF
ncbi:MAG: hypothetical protein ACYC8V_09510 [Caulobacteraceae bacterium]